MRSSTSNTQNMGSTSIRVRTELPDSNDKDNVTLPIKSSVMAYDDLAQWEQGVVLGRETPISLVATTSSSNNGSGSGLPSVKRIPSIRVYSEEQELEVSAQNPPLPLQSQLHQPKKEVAAKNKAKSTPGKVDDKSKVNKGGESNETNEEVAAKKNDDDDDEEASVESCKATFCDTRTTTYKTPSECLPPPPTHVGHHSPPIKLSKKARQAIKDAKRQKEISHAAQKFLGNSNLSAEEQTNLLSEIKRALDETGSSASLQEGEEEEEDDYYEDLNENSTFFSGTNGETTVFSGDETMFSNGDGTMYTNHTNYSSYYTNDGDGSDTENHSNDDGTFYTYDKERAKQVMMEMQIDDDDDTIAVLAEGCCSPCGAWFNNSDDDLVDEHIDWNSGSNTAAASSFKNRHSYLFYYRGDTLTTTDSISSGMGDSVQITKKKESYRKKSNSAASEATPSPLYLKQRLEKLSSVGDKQTASTNGKGRSNDLVGKSREQSHNELRTNAKEPVANEEESVNSATVLAHLQYAENTSFQEDHDDAVEVQPEQSLVTNENLANIALVAKEQSNVRSDSPTAKSCVTQSDAGEETPFNILETPIICNIANTAKQGKSSNTSSTSSIPTASDLKREMSIATQNASNQTSTISARNRLLEQMARERSSTSDKSSLGHVQSGDDSRPWREYVDAMTGKKYYSNGITTTWTRPPELGDDSIIHKKSVEASLKHTRTTTATGAVGQWAKTIRGKIPDGATTLFLFKRKMDSSNPQPNVKSTHKSEPKKKVAAISTNVRPNFKPELNAKLMAEKKTLTQPTKIDAKASTSDNKMSTTDRTMSWKPPALNVFMKKKSESKPSNHKSMVAPQKKSQPKQAINKKSAIPKTQAIATSNTKETQSKSKNALTTTKKDSNVSSGTSIKKLSVENAKSKKPPVLNGLMKKKETPKQSKVKPRTPLSPTHADASMSSEPSPARASLRPLDKQIKRQSSAKLVALNEMITKEIADSCSVATDNVTADSDASAVVMRSTDDGKKRVTMISFT